LAAATNQSMDPHTENRPFVLEEQNLSSIQGLLDFAVRLANKVKLFGLQWPFMLITVQI